MIKKIEHLLEVLIFNSRWLLAPFYLGLVVGIMILLIKFGQEFFHVASHAWAGSESDVILAILTLVDMSLVANLMLIIIFSGYENFVSKINTAGHEDRPDWMGKVDFSGLKVKVIGSIVGDLGHRAAEGIREREQPRHPGRGRDLDGRGQGARLEDRHPPHSGGVGPAVRAHGQGRRGRPRRRFGKKH
ncbi:MAG: YqhA family protein [Chromatiales bacterium]|nr:YqhA family protein [Chromatiales bacterium]